MARDHWAARVVLSGTSCRSGAQGRHKR